jgi:hypothetical protein
LTKLHGRQNKRQGDLHPFAGRRAAHDAPGLGQLSITSLTCQLSSLAKPCPLRCHQIGAGGAHAGVSSIEKSVLKRISTPENITRTVRYLEEDFVTSAVYFVDSKRSLI